VEGRVRASSPYWPSIYRRFIDDGFFVWEQDRASLDAFLAALNAALPTINITWDIATDSIPYMDLVISKDLSVAGDSVPLRVHTFQKPHNRYLYIPRVSFHRPSIYAAFVRGELIRYAVTNSTAAGFEHMKALFFQRLLDRGYSKAWLFQVFARVPYTSRAAHLQASGRRRRAAGQPQPPVFVATNGLAEMQSSLSAALNAVYTRHAQHSPDVRAAMCEATRLTVAYYNNPSLRALLVRARLR